MSTWPIWCARCTNQTPATHNVDAPGRHEVVCERHLDASMRWAGAKGRAAPIGREPITTATRSAQQTLFDIHPTTERNPS